MEDQQDLDVFADADTVVTRTVAGGGGGGAGGKRNSGAASVASNRKGKGKSGGDFQSIFAESLGAGASALGESIDDGGLDGAVGDGDDDMGTLTGPAALPPLNDAPAVSGNTTVDSARLANMYHCAVGSDSCC